MRKDLVLIIEDSEAQSYALARFCRQLGMMAFECRTLQSAREALKTRPEVFLIDVRLGDGSGLEFCRELRTNLNTQHVTIILMSAHLDLNFDHAELMGCGADAYLPKPINKDDLQKAFETLRQDRRTL